jgi:hypothetical protein
MIELISLEDTSQPLIEHFNAQRGFIRILAFVSPT